MNWIWVPWLSLALLVLADVLGRRGAQEPPPGPAVTRKAIGLVAGLSALCAVGRLPFALGRDALTRNVDEMQYALTATFVRDTGESLFGWGWNFHGHQLLYGLGTADQPFLAVDVASCAVVGLTAFALGLTVLRCRGGISAALLTVPFYALGLLRFEGLSSNKELYVNLFLGAYLLVRVGFAASPRVGLRVLAGACLGAAAVMKEQALLFVLVEPAIELFECLRVENSRGVRARRFLRHEALAAVGFFVPVGALLLAFATHGALGEYLSRLAGWAAGGGSPLGSLALEPLFQNLAFEEPSALVRVLDGLLPLWMSTVLLLGMVAASRVAASRRGSTLEVALTALAGVGVVAISIGFRWSSHYWMLLFPAFAPLAALRLLEIPQELKVPRRRLVGGVLALLLLVTASLEARYLASKPGQDDARGAGLSARQHAELTAVAAVVRAGTPQDAPILVWGWRPELYLLANRPPATRYVGGVTATKADVIEDLNRFPPPSVVVLLPPPEDVGERNPFSLAQHPELLAWLQGHGYAVVDRPLGYEIWGKP